MPVMFKESTGHYQDIFGLETEKECVLIVAEDEE